MIKLKDLFRRRMALEQGTGEVSFVPWADLIDDAHKAPDVLAEEARGLPGVGHGVRLQSGVLAQLTPGAYTGTFKPGATQPILPPPTVLLEPDPYWHPLTTWLSTVADSLQWHGNAFAYIGAGVTGYDGYPMRLPLLRADLMTWDPINNVYWHRAEGGTMVELPPGDVLHMALGVEPERKMGAGILAKYQTTLKIIRATEAQQFVVMRTGVPTGILSITTGGTVTPTDAETAKKRFLESQKVRGVAVVANAKFEPVQWDADQISMIPTREYNLRLASDMTGTPPYLLGVPAESRVYANQESEWTNFVRGSFGHLLNVIEAGLSSIRPRGTEVRFNIDQLLRADSATRWSIYEKALRTGVLTRQEVRDKEDEGPLPPDAQPISIPAQPSEPKEEIKQ